MEDVNKPRRIFLSPSKLECGSQEISSREIRLHLTFLVDWNQPRSQALSRYGETGRRAPWERGWIGLNARKFKKRKFILKVTYSLPSPLSMLKLPTKSYDTPGQIMERAPLLHVLKITIIIVKQYITGNEEVFYNTARENEIGLDTPISKDQSKLARSRHEGSSVSQCIKKLQWNLSFGTPPCRGHKICSAGKNVHIIFVSVTSTLLNWNLYSGARDTFSEAQSLSMTSIQGTS